MLMCPIMKKNILKWKILLKKTPIMEPEKIDPSNDLALLQYTGGTTGLSKGVMLTHDNLTANIQQAAEVLNNIGGEKQETFLSLLPFFSRLWAYCMSKPTNTTWSNNHSLSPVSAPGGFKGNKQI